MISMYYDLVTKKWYQQDSTEDVTFGKNNKHVLYSGSVSKMMLPFRLSKQGSKIGPLIGILAGDAKQGFSGNVAKCRRLQIELAKVGALCIIFTPSGLHHDYIEGFIYLENYKKWVKVTTPLPDIVYNRIPYRYMEQTSAFKKSVEILKKNDIFFFNPRFFSKWDTYQVLRRDKLVGKHLPYTILYQSKDDLKNMIEKFNTIYAKSDQGSKGKGIFKITTQNNNITVTSIHEEHIFPSINGALDYLHPIFINTPYILQEAINSDTYQGKRYDLRILAHGNLQGYIISGIGVRLSGDQQVTTHVPNGGSVISFNKVQDRFNIEGLQSLIETTGRNLCEGFNHYIGEFSMDVGKSTDGNYVIYEVNSKPMVFDELDIKQQGVDNLSNLLILMGKFGHNK